MPKLKAIAAAVLACAALAAHAQQPSNPPADARSAAIAQARATPGPQLPATDRRFMARAAQAGHAEVAAGRLAQSHGQDADVRAYGRMLVDDHQRANTRLQRIAHARGITLPTKPSAQQQEELQRLAAVDPQAFDGEFMQQMVRDHSKVIDLFREEAQREDRGRKVQDYAQRVLPTLEQHLRRAQSLQAGLGRPATAAAGAAGTVVRQASGNGDRADELADARQQVRESIQAVQKMKSDPRMAQLLERARGVFIVPSYGRGALGVGVQAGKGVLVTRQGGDFGSPAFYNMGGLSVGAQAGVAGGEVAFLLMTERAVQQFRSDRNFSLNLDAGLTIAAYSARGHASAGKVQDVIVWSDTQGAYAGLSLGVTDIVADNEANRAYYGRADATPLVILSGRVEDPYGNALGRVLGA